MKRKASTRICIILSLVSAALLMPASCGDGGERVFLVYGQYDSRHIYVNDVNAAAIKFIDYKGVSSNLF